MSEWLGLLETHLLRGFNVVASTWYWRKKIIGIIFLAT
jgi:hypothetical protein